MKSLVDSLKSLYEKMGGTVSDVADVHTVSGMVEKLSVSSGGGSGSGGTERYVVTFTKTDSNTYTCDRSLADVIEASSAGLDVVGIYVSGNTTAYLRLTYVNTSNAIFSCVDGNFATKPGDMAPSYCITAETFHLTSSGRVNYLYRTVYE